MVYGDSRHSTHECEVAQNPTEGHRQMYVVWGAGHHTTTSHRLRGEIGDLGTDPHTDSSDTKGRPETYIQMMAPLSLSPTTTPIKTSGDLVVFASMVNQRRTTSVLDCTDLMRRIRRNIRVYKDKNRMQLVGNYLEVF
jgi:hypothetical protein